MFWDTKKAVSIISDEHKKTYAFAVVRDPIFRNLRYGIVHEK